MQIRTVFFLLSCLLVSELSLAYTLRADAPAHYTVQPGDTLWDIANKYLVDPWEWEALWNNNPQINDPDHLHAGAVLTLSYKQGKPKLKRTQRGTYKLSPQVRRESIQQAIPTIPFNHIEPFLNKSVVFDSDSLTMAPYVIGFNGNQLIAASGQEVYVSAIPSSQQQQLTLFRPDKIYKNKAGRKLGYLATHVGQAQLVQPGKPATVKIQSIERGVRLKDRVLNPIKYEYSPYFTPRAPRHPLHGRVIDLFGGMTQVARGQVIVLDLGATDGAEVGHVLAIERPGRLAKDPIKKSRNKKKIRLPNARIGEVMLFRVFTHVSFGLIMRAEEAVMKTYQVGNP